MTLRKGIAFETYGALFVGVSSNFQQFESKIKSTQRFPVYSGGLSGLPNRLQKNISHFDSIQLQANRFQKRTKKNNNKNFSSKESVIVDLDFAPLGRAGRD